MPGCTLVFEWNKTDVSQFESSPAYADGGGAGQLVVTSSAEHGAILRVSGTAGLGAHVVWLAVTPLTFLDTRRDLYIEMDLLNTPVVGAYAGLALIASSGSNYSAINHLVAGSSEWASRIDADSRQQSGGTGGGISGGGFVQVEVRGAKPAGAPPHLSSFSRAFHGTGMNGEPRRTGQTRGNVNPFGSSWPLSSSWNNLDCDRWGLCLQSSGGNPLANAQLDILSLKIYRVGS